MSEASAWKDLSLNALKSAGCLKRLSLPVDATAAIDLLNGEGPGR